MAVDPIQAAIDALREAGSGGTANLDPIGVPGVVRVGDEAVPFEANGVAPRYFEGDDWMPAAMGPEDRARLQRLMAAAGIIPKGAEYREGVWDDVSRAAYRTVLAQANASGMNPQQVISEWANAQVTNKPDVKPYLSPDLTAIKADIKSVFRKRLGRDLTDGELPALVNEALTLDRAAYDNAVATTESGTGSQFDAAARFESYLEDRYKPEIQRVEGMVDVQTNREHLLGSIFAMDGAIQ